MTKQSEVERLAKIVTLVLLENGIYPPKANVKMVDAFVKAIIDAGYVRKESIRLNKRQLELVLSDFIHETYHTFLIDSLVAAKDEIIEVAEPKKEE